MAKVNLPCGTERLEIDLEVAQKSTILRNMIEDTGKEGEIPIPNIQLPILKKVIEYCEHYRATTPKEIKKPLVSKNLLENGVDEWDASFIEMEQMDDLIDLIVAANFLDIEGLVHLGCAKIASFFKGQTVEEIREVVEIEIDFTPQEEAQLREENRWAESAI